jgi:predicted NBD/HSP70 family sugar kinase
MVDIKTRAIPASLRRANERTVIGLLMRMGAGSRAQIAKAAGISQPTCGKIIDELIRLGVADEVEETAEGGLLGTRNRAGRPGRMVSLQSSQPRFITVQFDVMETSFALAPVGAPVEDQWQIVRPTTDSAAGWLRQAKAVSRQMPHKQLWGALVSAPGIVDERAGRVLFSPNIHWSEKADLVSLIREVWDVPVVLVQENRAAALGHLYAEPESQNFLLVDFGHGVGGAIIEGGRLFHSPLPLNSEIGHTPIPGNHRQCGCGATGCLETKLSRYGLLRSFVEANRGQAENWEALLAHVHSQGIRPWLAESLDAAASVIAGALNVLGLRRVIVTGSLAEMPVTVMDRLAAGVRQGSLWGRFGDVTCTGAPRRRIAGLVTAGIDRLLLPADGRRSLSPKV